MLATCARRLRSHASAERQSRWLEVEFSGQVADGDCGKICRFPPTLPAILSNTPPPGRNTCRVTMIHAPPPKPAHCQMLSGLISHTLPDVTNPTLRHIARCKLSAQCLLTRRLA